MIGIVTAKIVNERRCGYCARHIGGSDRADCVDTLRIVQSLQQRSGSGIIDEYIAWLLPERDGERRDVEDGVYEEKDVSLHQTQINNDGERPQQDTDGVSEDDGGRVASDAASGVESYRDRSDIRVYEEGLASKSDAHPLDSERAKQESEAERLIGLAKANGQYIPRATHGQLGNKMSSRSGESEVYDNREVDGRIYKVKNPYAKSPMKGGVQPEDAILEHHLHNKYFPETAYRFEGISDDGGDLRIVLSQEYVDGVDKPTDEEIAAALAEKGLKPEGNYRYGNDEVTVTDVTGDNAIVGRDGL